MELMTVSCNSCGAPLQVPAGAKFVTCNHCSCQLAVKHTDSVTFTEQLGEISERTNRIAKDVAELKYRQKLDDIDRRWERERESYMVTDKNGHRDVPSAESAIVRGVLGLAAGIVCMIMGIHSNGSGTVALVGLVVIAVSLFGTCLSCKKAEEYRKAEQAYRGRRAAVRRRRG